MAKKGQKFNNHSYETKIKIVNEYLNHGGSTIVYLKNMIYQFHQSKIGLNYIKLKKKYPKLKLEANQNLQNHLL